METETVSLARYLDQNGTAFLGFDVPEQVLLTLRSNLHRNR